MSPLSPAARTKLVGILGRLGSDHDGERAAAGLLATRFLKAHNLQWNDIVAGGDLPMPHFVVIRPSAPAWRQDLSIAVRHIAKLRTGEQDFAHAMTTLTTASPKQRRVLAEIADALRAQGLQ